MAAMAKETSLGPEVEEIERRILAFIREELLGPGVTVGRHDDLLSELLDSVAVLRLTAFLDEEFRIVTRPEDFVIENFQTVAVLGEHVRRAVERAARPATGGPRAGTTAAAVRGVRAGDDEP
jgi:acyl carrier protein